jgi:hypothetical protein
MQRRIRAAVLLLAMGWASAAAAADPKVEAKERFDHALTLVDQGAFAEAIAEFQRAYELMPHYTVLYNLGQAYVGLGRPVEAVDALTRYLGQGGSEIPSARRAEVEAEIRRQQARIAVVTLQVEPAGATVTLDDREVGHSPLPDPLRVGVGNHQVAARLEGYQRAERRFSVAGEERAIVSLKLEPESAPVPGPGWLRVDCAVRDVQVKLDGATLGATPLEQPVSVAIGTHQLAFQRTDHPAVVRTVTVPVGAELKVDCGMVALPPPAPPAPEPARGHEPSGSPRRTWAWALGGTGLGLAVGATALHFWNDGRYSSWRQEHDRLDSAAQSSATSIRSSDLDRRQAENDELKRSIQSTDRTVVGLAITGGALLATGTVFYVTSRGPKSYRVGAMALPGAAWAHAELGF